MAVSKRLRYEILRRDNHACRYCGGTAPDVVLTVDHVIPTALGGSDQPDNLVAACQDCNAGKSASSPDASLVADVAADAMQYRKAIEYASKQVSRDVESLRSLYEAFDYAWADWKLPNGEEIPRPPDWRESLRTLRSAGITGPIFADAVTKAMTKPGIDHADIWRYFCGVCWRQADEIRNRAAAALDEWAD